MADSICKKSFQTNPTGRAIIKNSQDADGKFARIAYAVLWLLRFALGACVFSFLGVVVWRLPRRESVVRMGRSRCTWCAGYSGTRCALSVISAELLPCLSYLLQGGKCRGCGEKIPARDFWIEVLGGLCSCACAYAFGGETAQAALAFVVLGILTVVALMDYLDHA